MRNFYCLIILAALIAVGDVIAFSTKKGMDMPRPAFKKAASMKETDESSSATASPHPGPAFAFATGSSSSTSGTISNSPSGSSSTISVAQSQQDDLDDDLIIGFGTVVVSCAVSLVLGFSLGYGT